MRSVNNFLKVEGHASLIRDASSNAIISTNDVEYEAYVRRREQEKKRQSLFDQHSKEIESIKQDVVEIKQMLMMLINNKGQ